jgi:4'-phosphopantetheinyl transferase
MAEPASRLVDDRRAYVWHLRLDRPPEPERALWQLLSEGERRRASEYRFSRHARRFVVRRGVLRLILADSLQTAPERVAIEEGRFGKPRLAGEGADFLGFSVAHSGDLALIALAPGREVGVDVERVRDDLSADEIVRRAFSARELGDYARIPAERRVAAFFAAWTRKESHCKALGTGLLTRLDSFSVSVDPDRPARLLEASPGELVSTWTLSDLDATPGYAAAITVGGACEEVERRPWPA